jgi:hypothetical protein
MTSENGDVTLTENSGIGSRMMLENKFWQFHQRSLATSTIVHLDLKTWKISLKWRFLDRS